MPPRNFLKLCILDTIWKVSKLSSYFSFSYKLWKLLPRVHAPRFFANTSTLSTPFKKKVNYPYIIRLLDLQGKSAKFSKDRNFFPPKKDSELIEIRLDCCRLSVLSLETE